MSNNNTKGWIGVGFDGTMATYETWVGATHTGGPIELMLERVRRWRKEGREVRVFTARVYPILYIGVDENPARALRMPHPLGGREAEAAVGAIRTFCQENLGEVLPITCVKDYGMIELWDDRCVQVQPNTGVAVGVISRGLG